VPEGVDDIHGSDRLALGVLGVGDGVANDVFQEDLEDTTGFLVDQARDTLDTTTACQTADCRLRDTLDVVAENLPVAFGAACAKSLAAFASA
jgi:hypothetical protein